MKIQEGQTVHIWACTIYASEIQMTTLHKFENQFWDVKSGIHLDCWELKRCINYLKSALLMLY